MKIKKILSSLACASPLLCVPLTLTSCAVYTNCLNGYTPGFKQIDAATYKKDAGLEKWFEKGKSTNDYIKQELLWSHAQSAKYVDEDETGIEGYTYKSVFSTYQANVSYGNMYKDNENNIRVSFKVNTDIQSDDIYYYGSTKEQVGTGVTHYQVEWTCKDLRFDSVKETKKTKNGTRDYWLLKPYVYDNEKNQWWWDEAHLFDDKEQVSFNARYIVEIYKAGIQQYGFEATEAAIISKGLEYNKFMLYKLVGYFCCFWSYALDNCTYQEG